MSVPFAQGARAHIENKWETHLMAISPYVITSSHFVLDRNDRLDQRQEETLKSDVPIIDPHVHLYDEPGNFHYLYEQARKGQASGHNIVATVFVECRSFYRADGPEEMKPVGETEFANGIAAMAASGRYGKTRLNAAIIGKASLLLGAAVEKVLEARRGDRGVEAGNPRGRKVRQRHHQDGRRRHDLARSPLS